MNPRLSLLCVSLVLAAAAARAHDTWFEALPGAPELALGTGTLYPQRESGIAAAYLRQQGCITADGSLALKTLRNSDDALIVALPSGATSCWAQLSPFEIELPADKIDLYLKEVRPPQAIVEAWSSMKARGLPWRESYVKHSRIELSAPVIAKPSPMDFDMLLTSPCPQVGQPLQIQVLRDGVPLADFAVELRSERTRAGFWRRTDAEGRLGFQPPLPGRWIARGVDLRLSTERQDEFDSLLERQHLEVESPLGEPDAGHDGDHQRAADEHQPLVERRAAQQEGQWQEQRDDAELAHLDAQVETHQR